MGREIEIYRLHKNKENEELIKLLKSKMDSSIIRKTFKEIAKIENKNILLLYTSFTKSFANMFMLQLGDFEYQFNEIISDKDKNYSDNHVYSDTYFNLFLDYLILFSFLIEKLAYPQDVEMYHQDITAIKESRGQDFIKKIEILFSDLLISENYKETNLYRYSSTSLDTCIKLKQFIKEDNGVIFILDSQ